MHVHHARPVPLPFPVTVVAAIFFRAEELCADAEARHLQLVRLGVVSQDGGDDGLLPEERLERAVVIVALLAKLAIPLRLESGIKLVEKPIITG